MTGLEDGEKPGALSALSGALKGIADSQFQLAVILEEEEKDFELAIAWYQKAAQQGHAEAAFRTGLLCLREKLQRQPEAVYWFEQAANAGHASAQYHLALVHEKGLGVQINPEEALKWHRLAAQCGNAQAREKLASLDAWLGMYS